MLKQKTHQEAFTLVELIVVIVILAILATISFLSFSSQSGSARDSGRLANVSNISKGLGVFYSTAGSYPIPDSFITINAGTGYVMYQGNAGSKLLSMIKMSDAKDYLDSNYFSYSVDKTKTHYTVGGFLENPATSMVDPDSFFGLWKKANAADYSKRYFFSKGDTVGIITESGSSGIAPLEQTTTAGSTIDLLSTPKNLTLTTKSVTTTGSGMIAGIIQSQENHNFDYTAPVSCPSGFISVPGNIEFNQPGFCVAKYKMKVVGGIKGPSASGITYNSHDYVSGETIISNASDLPITTITQSQAIAACKTMGAGYHLITEDEWMTLARNVEIQPSNWSSGVVGNGYIYMGHSDSNPSGLIVGSTDDSQGYINTGDAATGSGDLGYGAQFISNVEQAYKGQKRTLMLSNGQVIWDLAGNAMEHVNKANTIDGSSFNDGNNWTLNACGGTGWYSYNPGQTIGTAGSGLCNFQAPYSYSSVGPKTPNLNEDNGIGRISSSMVVNGVFIRGGIWDHGARSGIYQFFMGWDDTATQYALGFRCAK